VDILLKAPPEERIPAPEPPQTTAELQVKLFGVALLCGVLLWITWPVLFLSINRFPYHEGLLWNLVRGANLIFHEAGHVVFWPFGRFLMVLGGTILQLLIPVICLLTFHFKEKDKLGFAFCLWWLGTNLMDVGVYAADARALRLFLITGGTGQEVEGHDWEYLLGRLNLLEHDLLIGGTFYLLGKALLVAGLVYLIVQLVETSLRLYQRGEVQ